MTEQQEPDWESICAHVQVGDDNYWPCAARREELQMLQEMREEPPFEDRLAERAQPIPESPAVRAERKRAEREQERALAERKKERAVKQKLAQRKEPAQGIAGVIEQFAMGDIGRYVLMIGPFVLLGLYLWTRSPSEKPGSDGKVDAWGVRWTNAAGVVTERLFLDAKTASDFAAALKQAGAQSIMIANQPVRVTLDDARLAKNQPPATSAAA